MEKPKHSPIVKLMRKTRLHLNICLNSVNNVKIWFKQMPWVNPALLRISQFCENIVQERYTQYFKWFTAIDATAISAICKIHFESLLNSVITEANRQNVKDCKNTEHMCDGNYLLIILCMIQHVTDKLKSRK